MTSDPMAVEPGPTSTVLPPELTEGEVVLLIDAKGRRYLVTLQSGREFHSHAGYISHDELVGVPDGTTVRSTRGATYTALRPTLSDFILKMPRGAQVIYPKDIGPLLMIADIGPGVRVLESGVGSGALSMGMLRAGAHITGYERRDDFAAKARANVERFLGADAASRYDVQLRDVYDGVDGGPYDRVVLDLPEPWKVVPNVVDQLRPGGLIAAYSPSVLQVTQFRDALDHDGRYTGIDTVEIMERHWHIEDRAVRPGHRMVAHTGFLTSARRLA